MGSMHICFTKVESSLCAQWVVKDPSFLHADSEDSDQTGRMPRLICLRWAHMPFCLFCHEAAHKSVRFVCGLSFQILVDELISPTSGNVSFAVQITKVKIHDGNQELTAESTNIGIENVSHSITCVHGPSRPSPLYRFYLGTNMFPRNDTLTFTSKRH